MSPNKRSTFTFVRGYSCISERLFHLVPPDWKMIFRELADFSNGNNVKLFHLNCLPINVMLVFFYPALGSFELPDMTRANSPFDFIPRGESIRSQSKRCCGPSAVRHGQPAGQISTYLSACRLRHWMQALARAIFLSFFLFRSSTIANATS